jgi:hypothetical protein
MSTKKDLITNRGYLPEDRSFILACWLRGVYYGNTFFSDIPKGIFMEHYHKVLERFLDNPKVTITVACLKDDPQVILGYSVTRLSSKGEQIMDWAFVKKAWRNIGIARSLTPSNLQVVSHQTKIGKALKPAGVVYNPFI